jgi:hypothetical protein
MFMEAFNKMHSEAAIRRKEEHSIRLNYTRNEWRWKLHSKRVKMKTKLETSENENYTRNECTDHGGL